LSGWRVAGNIPAVPKNGGRQIRHYRKKPPKNGDNAWLVVAAQPLLSRQAFNPFADAVKALARHHDSFRERVSGSDVRHLASVNGTIVAIMPVDAVEQHVAGAWRHLAAGPEARRPETHAWRGKAVVTIGDVVRLNDDEDAPEPYGEAIEECVRLLRDVAEPGDLLITEPVYRRLRVRDEGQFAADGEILAIEPEELVEKMLLPAEPTSIALVSPRESREEKSPHVIIVLRPSLRADLLLLEGALRGLQERFETLLPPIRGTLRDPLGSTGAVKHFADHLVSVTNAVEGDDGPIPRLTRAWADARQELGRHEELQQAIEFAVETTRELMAMLEELDHLYADGAEGSPKYRAAQRRVDSLLPKLKAAPAAALKSAATLRERYEEQFDADGR
jgi:hypothetical protein